jgi:hypothetical protein
MQRFDSAMPMDATLDSHNTKGRRLGVGEEQFQCPLIGGMQELGPVQTLLALVLLEQQVIAAVPLESEIAASCAS